MCHRSKQVKEWAIFWLMIFGAFRFLQHMVFQRLLNTLTQAMIKTRWQLLHTFLILVIVLMGFSYTGHLVLSRQVADFRGYTDSFRYTVELAFRAQTLNYVAMKNIGSVGTSYALLMKVLVVGVALKMLLALIIAAYKQLQKEDTNEIRGVWQDMKVLFYLGINDTFVQWAVALYEHTFAKRRLRAVRDSWHVDVLSVI